ncbi:MAG: NADH-quinone oxidoreductase subunit C, partial [Candidatus Bathyarchaeota archaeon]|nr:NADH-quinone oxidoreductase subunit C [Candidatus Bathyarchaeota archaeon]
MRKSDLEKLLRRKVQEVIAQGERRFSVRTVSKNLKAAVKKLMGLDDYSHLSTITAVDIESGIEMIYHIVCKEAMISLKVESPKDKPVLPTIVDLIPGAALYEREVHDLFGVNFKGNTDLSPLLLPDRWPEGVYPLRKWWTAERISNRMRG